MVVVPQFILKKIYRAGSLRQVPEGFAFDIINPIGPSFLTRINSVRLGPFEFLASQIQIVIKTVEGSVEAVFDGEQITEQSPALLRLNHMATCVLKIDERMSSAIEAFEHKTRNLAEHVTEQWAGSLQTLTVDLFSREAGKVVISVQDALTPTRAD
jgi:hypothetical protein